MARMGARKCHNTTRSYAVHFQQFPRENMRRSLGRSSRLISPGMCLAPSRPSRRFPLYRRSLTSLASRKSRVPLEALPSTGSPIRKYQRSSRQGNHLTIEGKKPTGLTRVCLYLPEGMQCALETVLRHSDLCAGNSSPIQSSRNLAYFGF